MGMEDELKLAFTTVQSGAAVCLLGAGFSRAATDAQGRKVPSTESLTAEIKDALGIEQSEAISLTDAAEYAGGQEGGTAALRSLMLARLTLCSPSPSQCTVVNLPWRALFTTNFDDIVERAYTGSGLTVVTPATNPSVIPPDRTPVYYMHGRARDLLERDVDPAFIISESNYLQLNDRNRELYARFFNEVFCARKVIVIGYSLRDLEIARGVLGLSSASREKTIIICHPSDGKVARARLEKFGQVCPIEIDRLEGILKSLPALTYDQPNGFQFLQEVKVERSADEVSSDDFIKIILLGEIDLNRYLSQITGEGSGSNFTVDRSSAIEAVLAGSDLFIQRFVVSSDFGNGKSVFLGQLAVKAIERGYRVAIVDTRLNEVFPEIDSAINSGQRFLFVVDDVVRYREVARYIGSRLTTQVTLVCTTRGDQDQRAYEALAGELGGAVKHVDLNKLNDSEIEQWDSVLERWGYWGERIQWPQNRRLEFLRQDCGSENRSVILSLFRSSRLAEQIDRIVDFFLRDKRQHISSFAALLIASLAQRHVSWESLVSWLGLDEDGLRRDLSNSELSYLFNRGRQWNAFTSSQLAEFILRNRFVSKDRDVLVSIYSAIVLKTAESAGDSRSGLDARENLKELMKFRFLTRLFGGDDQADRLIGAVYMRLSQAARIRGNPQFWLQFAMSRMEVDDLASAEKYLENALGLANERGRDYSPFQILDQRARLYFRKGLVPGRPIATQEIKSALRDLLVLTRDQDYEVIYPFRAVPLVRDFLEANVERIDADIRLLTESFLAEMKKIGAGFDRLPRSQKGETRLLKDALSDALLVLRNA